MNRNTSNKSQQADFTPGKEVPQMGQKPWHGKLFAQKHPKSDKWFWNVNWSKRTTENGTSEGVKLIYFNVCLIPVWPTLRSVEKRGENVLFPSMLDPVFSYYSFCGQARGWKLFYSQVCLIPVCYTTHSKFPNLKTHLLEVVETLPG